MRRFMSTPPLSTDEFKQRIERLEEDAREGLVQTREMHRQLLRVRAGAPQHEATTG